MSPPSSPGGWYCFNKENCDSRYETMRRLMSSSKWPQTKTGQLPFVTHPSLQVDYKDRERFPNSRRAPAAARGSPGARCRDGVEVTGGDASLFYCAVITVICPVMTMERKRTRVMTCAAVSPQAQGSCPRCPRKTLTGGTPTWCKHPPAPPPPTSKPFALDRSSQTRPCLSLCRFIPYCSSDVWSGATPKTEQSKTRRRET